MRTSDRQRLSEPFREGGDVERETTRALDVVLPNVERLDAEIFGDLREVAPHGIFWWSELPAERRVLIGDQLYACVQSITTNMVEAQLHFLELLDWAERTGTRVETVCDAEAGGVRVVAVRPSSAMEVLAPWSAALHVAGVIRALASALDCLAGAIVGVVGLRAKILKADFKAVRRVLRGKTGDRADERSGYDVLQEGFAETLEERIDAAGPRGWVDWMLDYRNMLVHRGRRIQIGQLVPRLGPHAVGRDGTGTSEGAGVRTVQHLPRDPARSDVEVHRGVGDPTALVLTEDARGTVAGLVGSTGALIEDVVAALLVVWDDRRRNAGTMGQPDCQWGSTSDVTGFPGYQPDECPLGSADVAMMNPLVARRLGAASVLRREDEVE